MYFYIDDRSGNASIYEVADPLQYKERVTMVNSKPSYLFIIAQKFEEKEIFKIIPQQSDYEHIVWKNKSYNLTQTSNQIKSKWAKRLVPITLKMKLYLKKRKIIKFYNRHTQPTGDSNRLFFKKIDKN